MLPEFPPTTISQLKQTISNQQQQIEVLNHRLRLFHAVLDFGLEQIAKYSNRSNAGTANPRSQSERKSRRWDDSYSQEQPTELPPVAYRCE